MNTSLLSFVLWGYLIWIFVAKNPATGHSWAKDLGTLLANSNVVCPGSSTAPTATSTTTASTTQAATSG